MSSKMNEEVEDAVVLKRNRKTNLDWTPAQCFQLISLVKKYPCIWDITSIYYKERSRREIVWGRIAKHLKLPQNDIVAKWALLRQQFRNNHTKFQKSNKPVTRVRKSPNEYYEPMKFIAPVLELQGHMRANNLEEPPESFKLQHQNTENCDMDPLSEKEIHESVEIKEEEEEDEAFEMKAEEIYEEQKEVIDVDASRCVYLSQQVPVQQKLGLSIPLKIKKTETKFDGEESLDYACILKNAVEALRAKDEDQFEIWGRSIAATLRNYPDAIAVRRFKAAVSLNLAKLEAGQFDSENDVNSFQD